MRSLLPLASLLSLFCLAVPAAAADAAPENDVPPKPEEASFGRSGQLIIMAGSQVNLTRYSWGLGPSATAFGLSPMLHYSVTDHVTVGARATFLQSVGSNVSSTAVSFTPLVGYTVPLGRSVSLWPQAGPSYEVGRSTAESSVDTTVWSVGATVPVIVQLAPHFFVGAGPSLSVHWTRYELSSGYSRDTRDLAYGLSTMLGGWI